MYKLTFFTKDEDVALSLYRTGDATPGIHQAELFLMTGAKWPGASEDEDL